MNEHKAPASPVLPDLVSLADAARMLAVKRSKFYELLRTGEVEAIKIGANTCVTCESIRAFIARQPRAQFRPLPKGRSAHIGRSAARKM